MHSLSSVHVFSGNYSYPGSKGPWAQDGRSGPAHGCVRARCGHHGLEDVLLLGYDQCTLILCKAKRETWLAHGWLILASAHAPFADQEIAVMRSLLWRAPVTLQHINPPCTYTVNSSSGCMGNTVNSQLLRSWNHSEAFCCPYFPRQLPVCSYVLLVFTAIANFLAMVTSI